MDALKEEAFIVRHAVPADVPALNEAIARIDGETEFLGLPGEYLRRWAPGFAERLAVMNEKGTGAYVIAAAGGEIVGFLGAFAGANARRCSPRSRTGRADKGRGGSTCGLTRKTRAALRSTRGAASRSKAASSTAPAPMASGAIIS